MWNDVRTLNAVTNLLLGLVVLALLGSGVWWVVQRPLFTLQTIRVESMDQTPLKRVNALTIRASALPQLKGNFFTADLKSVRVAFESVPWVRRVMVRREWPNKLIVTLEEYDALGTWGENGRLLSNKGDVFVANLAEAEEDGKLLEFAGPEGSEKEVFNRYVELADWFKRVGLTPESVKLSSRYAWSVKMDSGMVVELGREQSDVSLKERVDRLVSVYPQLLERLNGKIAHVDMRYPNGLALKADGLVLTALNGKK
jgi:cell division protein FtsQ